MKQIQGTYFGERCAVKRAGACEVTVAVRVDRAVEHRMAKRSGHRDAHCGHRQYVYHCYGEKAAWPSVSENPWMHISLPVPRRCPQRPVLRRGPQKRRRIADRRMHVEDKSDAMIVVATKLANKAWTTVRRSWWSEASHLRGNLDFRHAIDTGPGSGATKEGSVTIRQCWSGNATRVGATRWESRMRRRACVDLCEGPGESRALPRELVKVKPHHPTQQRSNCNVLPGDKVAHAVRSYRCKHYDSVFDRDVNAAKNIRLKGLKSFQQVGRTCVSGGSGMG